MVDEFTFIKDVLKHKFWVSYYLFCFCTKLIWRAIIHDITKLTPPEIKKYVEANKKLHGLTYGSVEYKKSCKELGEALTHHYKVNSHHPEYFEDGYLGMNFVDIIEMFYDWKAACKKHGEANLSKSLCINKSRFNLSDDVYRIMKNSL